MKKFIDENGLVIVAIGMVLVFFIPIGASLYKKNLENQEINKS